MLTTPTLDKLNALNLPGMARAFAEQLERTEYAELSFEERLGLLVDREAQDRDNRRLERNLRTAKLRTTACVEDLDFRRSRGLERSLILSLAEAHWVTAHRNVLIVGPTGVGKTFVACALAQAALRRGHRALPARPAPARRARPGPRRRPTAAAHGGLGQGRRARPRRPCPAAAHARAGC